MGRRKRAVSERAYHRLHEGKAGVGWFLERWLGEGEGEGEREEMESGDIGEGGLR